MKDKPIKQPWPRRAKITVWVLGIIIAASAIVNIIAVTQWYGPYQKWIDYNTGYLPPMEEPPKEIKPKAQEAAEVSAPQISEIQKPVTRFWVPPLYGMSPELKKKIFVDGKGESTMIVETFRRRKLPNGEWIDILPNGEMVYNGSPLTKEGADLLEEWFRKRQPEPIRFSSHPHDDSK